VKKQTCKGRVVAEAGELADGTTKKFELNCGRRCVEGILVQYKGKLYSYVNRCCHVSMPMDWVDNQFFTEDRRYLICATHGATYEPTTGECVWGPCYGGCLQSVPIEIIDGRVLAYCPAEEP
jgi:nitrite reductase/ring-hydroxylating ferredoxin subunit